MSTKLGVGLISVLLVIYLFAVFKLAVNLMVADDWIARGIGIALVVLPLIGAWAMVAELRFGVRSQQLTTRLAAEGNLPVDNLPKRTSGRPERDAADAEFPIYREAVEAQPTDWRSWFRLGLAYDASGDRRRARKAVRQAITLERTERKTTTLTTSDPTTSDPKTSDSKTSDPKTSDQGRVPLQ